MFWCHIFVKLSPSLSVLTFNTSLNHLRKAHCDWTNTVWKGLVIDLPICQDHSPYIKFQWYLHNNAVTHKHLISHCRLFTTSFKPCFINRWHHHETTVPRPFCNLVLSTCDLIVIWLWVCVYCGWSRIHNVCKWCNNVVFFTNSLYISPVLT